MDDNINALSPARWLPYPANWAQAHAAQPLVALPVRHNLPLTELGVSLVCNVLKLISTVCISRSRKETAD